MASSSPLGPLDVDRAGLSFGGLPPTPIREALLFRFQDPGDAAAVRRLGDLHYELVKESGQFGADDEENRVRPALLAVARDFLLEVSNVTEIGDECRWNQELPEEKAQLAGRVEAWSVQVQLLARSIFRTLGEDTADPLAVNSAPQP